MTTDLREAHAHILMHGQALSMLSLGHCLSREECLGAIRDRKTRDPWLIACSMRSEAWPDTRPPTRLELDDACPDRPCCVWSFDRHTIAASSRALDAASITRDTPDPPRGIIARDQRGDPTGVLFEGAAQLLWSVVPQPSPKQARAFVQAGITDLRGLGFTEVHDLHAPASLGPLLAELSDQDSLDIDVRVYTPLGVIEESLAASRSWRRDRVRLAGAKIFVDGTLNARTAWMLEPYADPIPSHPCGTAMMTPTEIRDAIRRVDGLGLPLAAHAIGDAAVRAMLDAIEDVRPRTPGFRIEHAELVHPLDVPRFARLGVTCSVQPCHLLADIEALRRSLADRLDRVLPLRSLIDSGCVPGELLLFGSDVPIVRADPGDSLQAAVHRRRTGRPLAERIAPEESITAAEAWLAFGAARGA